MKTLPIGKTGLEAPVLAVGCMRLNTLDKPLAERFLSKSSEFPENSTAWVLFAALAASTIAFR